MLQRWSMTSLLLLFCFIYHLLIKCFLSFLTLHTCECSPVSRYHKDWNSFIERFCPATLTTTLPPIRPFATTLLVYTIPLRHSLFTLFPIETPHWGYRWLSFGFSNPEDGTDRLSLSVSKKLAQLASQ
jgi:hypothetical protein